MNIDQKPEAQVSDGSPTSLDYEMKKTKKESNLRKRTTNRSASVDNFIRYDTSSGIIKKKFSFYLNSVYKIQTE